MSGYRRQNNANNNSTSEERRQIAASNQYRKLFNAAEVPKPVPKNWCKCNFCPPAQEVLPEDAICCAKVRELYGNSELTGNWWYFIGDKYQGCYANHPKIQNLINNKEELDSFIILDTIRKDQLEEAQGYDRIRGYHFQDRQAKYRYACYRKITMLVHGIYGAKNYVSTPACIVAAVRRKYPSASTQPNEPNATTAADRNEGDTEDQQGPTAAKKRKNAASATDQNDVEIITL
uniref:Uncharacterized protein n=1 Tax=Panagrolaimus sp. ES5 TaxID=591445 RepID=A0AC34FE80_9BILA